MKKILTHLLAASLLAAALASTPGASAADSTAKTQDKATGPANAATEKTKPKRDWYPFGGMVASVDKQANTISLKKKTGERVLKLDANSTLQVNGKPAAIGSVKVGDYAHGKLHKDASANEVITDARFEKEKPSKDKTSLNKRPPTTPAPKTTQ